MERTPRLCESKYLIRRGTISSFCSAWPKRPNPPNPQLKALFLESMATCDRTKQFNTWFYEVECESCKCLPCGWCRMRYRWFLRRPKVWRARLWTFQCMRRCASELSQNWTTSCWKWPSICRRCCDLKTLNIQWFFHSICEIWSGNVWIPSWPFSGKPNECRPPSASMIMEKSAPQATLMIGGPLKSNDESTEWNDR